MTKVYIVLAEYPFDGRFTCRAFATPRAAEDAAVEIVNEILDEFWEYFDDDHTHGPKPVADRMNWEAIVEELGAHDAILQQDGWGRWEVVLRPTDIET